MGKDTPASFSPIEACAPEVKRTFSRALSEYLEGCDEWQRDDSKRSLVRTFVF